MKNTHTLFNRIHPLLIGLLVSALFSIAAFMLEPSLLPLAAVAGPALIGLVSTPDGRRIYRYLGIAVLIGTAVTSIMLYVPTTA